MSKQSENSDLVLTGTTEDIGETQTEAEQIGNSEVEETYRTVSVWPEEVFKGNATGQIQIRTCLGQPFAHYRQREKALFFLENMEDYYVSKGRKYGKYTVQDSSINRKIVPDNAEREVSMETVEDLVSPS